MNTGLTQPKIDKRDFDFHPSFGATAGVAELPKDFNIDLGLWLPDQEAPEPIFNNPALPNGCTDYTQADLCSDEVGKLLNPILLENMTHANANGGTDIRFALSWAKKVYGFTNYFSVRAYGVFDQFDVIRLALWQGQTEKRAVSCGTKWYYDFNATNQIITSMDNPTGGYHNWAICGWKTINGVPYLIGRSWQGKRVGLNGEQLFPREIINSLYKDPYACFFTITKVTPTTILPIKLDIWETIMSWIQSLRAALNKQV